MNERETLNKMIATFRDQINEIERQLHHLSSLLHWYTPFSKRKRINHQIKILEEELYEMISKNVHLFTQRIELIEKIARGEEPTNVKSGSSLQTDVSGHSDYGIRGQRASSPTEVD